jgi:protoheme IX farnesyltransferase
LTDFFELTKPRLNFLVVVTTFVGFYLAHSASSAASHWLLLIHTVAGTALTAAASSVLNQLIERRHDALMHRTKNRPLPAGRVTPMEALVFGVALAVAGISYLAIAVNLLTAGLGLFTLLAYLFVYTPMKRVSTLNTVIGAIPGAIPPVMGFTAVENAIPPAAWMLFGVLFLWQMPHFLAIAVMYRDDYARGGFRMLPVLDPTLTTTCRMVIVYTLGLIAVSLLAVAPLRVSGGLYLVAALMLGLYFLLCGVRLMQTRARTDARKLFFASIIYLPLLLAAMMIDKL